jgi:hypothetical protein
MHFWASRGFTLRAKSFSPFVTSPDRGEEAKPMAIHAKTPNGDFMIIKRFEPSRVSKRRFQIDKFFLQNFLATASQLLTPIASESGQEIF